MNNQNQQSPFTFLFIASLWYSFKVLILVPGGFFSAGMPSAEPALLTTALKVSPVVVYLISWVAYLLATFTNSSQHSVYIASKKAFTVHCVWIAACIAIFFIAGTPLSSFDSSSLGRTINFVGAWLTPFLMAIFVAAWHQAETACVKLPVARTIL